MFLYHFRCEIDQVFELRFGSVCVIDPRANRPRHVRFDISYDCDEYDMNVYGQVIILRRIADDTSWYGDEEALRDEVLEWDPTVCQLRVYDSATDNIPNYFATTYNYFGLPGERAPFETTVLTIDASVEIIRRTAFVNCYRIEKCVMDNGVRTIQEFAFADCWGLKVIKLSQNLRVIGVRAFHECRSLEALFLPPSVATIQDSAFYGCKNLQIISLLRQIPLNRLGDMIFEGCDTLFRVTKLPTYDQNAYVDDDQVHQNIFDFYEHLNPLYRTCLSTNVNTQISAFVTQDGRLSALATDDNEMTPLHILAMNLHASAEAVSICFALNIRAMFERDSNGRSPLDYMAMYGNFNFYDHLHPLYQVCIRNSIDDQNILEYIELQRGFSGNTLDSHGITPLHILAANPDASTSTITYFEQNMHEAFVRDSCKKNPLDYLMRYEVSAFVELVRRLTIHRASVSRP